MLITLYLSSLATLSQLATPGEWDFKVAPDDGEPAIAISYRGSISANFSQPECPDYHLTLHDNMLTAGLPLGTWDTNLYYFRPSRAYTCYSDLAHRVWFASAKAVCYQSVTDCCFDYIGLAIDPPFVKVEMLSLKVGQRGAAVAERITLGSESVHRVSGSGMCFIRSLGRDDSVYISNPGVWRGYCLDEARVTCLEFTNGAASLTIRTTTPNGTLALRYNGKKSAGSFVSSASGPSKPQWGDRWNSLVRLIGPKANLVVRLRFEVGRGLTCSLLMLAVGLGMVML
ncbi:hypothetical protein FGG08_004157 [Glutinoglossum americanum]|uniref:Uncharacterized protein n=1 Tax=Glutinoglossum americanum TaxID=1670608 RepID=A0A9P8I126_9PEZI|nr:hypothetical protein FGG08_004157 [Glutinoglossum americanum]